MKTAYINCFPPKKFYTAEDWVSKLEYLGENTGNWVYVSSLSKQPTKDKVLFSLMTARKITGKVFGGKRHQA